MGLRPWASISRADGRFGRPLQVDLEWMVEALKERQVWLRVLASRREEDGPSADFRLFTVRVEEKLSGRLLCNPNLLLGECGAEKLVWETEAINNDNGREELCRRIARMNPDETQRANGRRAWTTVRCYAAAKLLKEVLTDYPAGVE